MAEDWKKKWSESGYYFSPEDMKRAEYDEGFRNRTFENKAGWYAAQAAGDQAGMDRYHQAQETNRGTAYGGGYSGGAWGNEYNPFATPVRSDSGANMVEDTLARMAGYDKYLDPLYSNLQGKVDAISSREPFSYDYRTDPAWQAYKKEYTREGRRASEDTLGQYAAMTGGMPSTAAMTAASQANDYYNAKMTDKIPELYQLAYSMYADEANRNMNELNALRGYSNDLYGRWGDEFGRLGTLYGLGAEERDYADKKAKEAEAKEASKLYAYGDDGSTYDIGSPKGQYFIANAQPGQTMTGGDGSTWTKEADGSVTITRGGQTWRIVAPATGRGGGGGGVKTADMIDYDSDRGKSLVSASQNNPALAQQYLATYWDSMGYTERFSLLQNMGYDNQTAMALAREGGLSGKDFNAYISANAPASDTLMETINSEIKNQKDAVNYLQDNGIMAQPLSQEQWAMTSGSSVFKTYSDYLKAFVYEYMGG